MTGLIAVSTAEALARLGRERDPEAWRLLVERHGEAMYRAAYAVTRDQHLAADACQEAFLHVRDGARRFQPRAGDVEAMARAWLMRVAASSALTLMRGLRRRQRRERGMAVEAGAEPGARPGDDEGELRIGLAREVADAVAELPRTLREPLMLHVYSGLDHAAVAAALGVTPGNARV